MSERITAPCKGCTDRTLTCHDTCEKYRTWAAERKAAQRALWPKEADGLVMKRVKARRIYELKHKRK